MKKLSVYVLSGLLLVLVLLLGSVTPALEPVDAATVIGRQSVTMLDGATAYTTTTYTSAYLVGVYGEVALQINDDVSGTNTITVTPQFSMESVCSSATDWVDAAVTAVYPAETASVTVSTLNTNTLTTTLTTTNALTFDTVDVQFTVTGDDAETVRLAVSGNCMRVKLETATTFTPTLYAWLVNTQ